MADNLSKQREVFMLQKCLDNEKETESCFHFTEKLKENIECLRFSQNREFKYDYIASKEFTVVDQYILYAVNSLRVADVESIFRYLNVLKRTSPQLAMNVDDIGFIKKRINKLAMKGFLYEFQYVLNSKVSLGEAYELEKNLLEEERSRSLTIVETKPAISLDDEFFDDDDDGVTFANFDEKEYNKILAQRRNEYKQKKRYANTVYRTDRFHACFGEEARLITLYVLEDTSYSILSSIFGANCVTQMGLISVKMAYEKIGIAAAGFVTARLCELPTYKKMKQGLLNSKKLGKYTVQSDLEFVIPGPDGGEFRYYVGVFKAYCYSEPTRMLKGYEKGNMYDTVFKLQNYIGIKGLTKKSADAIVVVVVNDTVDMLRFIGVLLECGVTEAECSRIYFTGEGLIRESGAGVKKMLQMRLDSTKAEGYTIKFAPLPITPIA